MKIILTAFLFIALAFSAFAAMGIENYVSSSANMGGNRAANSGLILTGDASANASVKTEAQGGHAATTVEATAEANGKKEETSKIVTGSGEVRVEVKVSTDGETSFPVSVMATSTGADGEVEESKNVEISAEDGSAAGGKNMTISRVAPEQGGAQRIIGNILLALKNTFAYVVSFFF